MAPKGFETIAPTPKPIVHRRTFSGEEVIRALELLCVEKKIDFPKGSAFISNVVWGGPNSIGFNVRLELEVHEWKP